MAGSPKTVDAVPPGDKAIGQREAGVEMPRIEYKSETTDHRFFLNVCLVLAILTSAIVLPTPTVFAQGLNRISNSYVTPFPEQNRYRLYVFGDSLGDGIWAGLYRAFNPDGNMDIVKKSRVSTGFVRTDYYDWNKKITGILAAEKVHIAVIMVGANDMQPIRASGKWHKVGTPEWRKLYANRIDKFIKQLKGSNAAVYWVGLPIMRAPKHNAAMEVMNEIFRERAFINGIKFVDTYNGFADQFGRYSAFGPDLTGQVGRLRANDGVHFTIRGYRKLAHFAEREIRRDMRQARSERDIPLAGSEAEQARAIRRPRAGTQKKSNVITPKKGARRMTPEAFARKTASDNRVASARVLAPLENSVALPSADAMVAGIKLIRPEISQATLAAVGSRYTPTGETIAREMETGVTAMASISPISDSDLSAAQRRLPVTQRPYYRVLIKGEGLQPKPGRADDFAWQGG